MGVAGMTILTVMGWSKTRELHLQWRGQPVSYDLEPWVAIWDRRVKTCFRDTRSSQKRPCREEVIA